MWNTQLYHMTNIPAVMSVFKIDLWSIKQLLVNKSW